MELELPAIFLLSTHLQPAEQHELEDKIPSLTYDVNEAEIVLGKISRRERALFELRRLQLDTVPVDAERQDVVAEHVDDEPATEPSPKRRKLSDLGTSAGTKDDGSAAAATAATKDTVKVVKLSWLTDSITKGALMPTAEYLVYEGVKHTTKRQNDAGSGIVGHQREPGKGILDRAAEDYTGISPSTPSLQSKSNKSAGRYPSNARPGRGTGQHPTLARESTFEHDVKLPGVPEYLHTTYSCQRPTPVDPPNSQFIEELKSIRLLRLLQGDQIGVRAYSTSVCALSAYPHEIQSPQEVARLPGCGNKIAELYQTWHSTGQTQEVKNSAADPKVFVIKQFYNIWGVGDTTAREFYQKGWRDLDDVVEYGWGSLSRVQQIGVKYYDEFLLKIPRAEVEEIGKTILQHARRIDCGFEMTIVGGYRRGKNESGDVDVIVSHHNEDMTLNLVERLVLSLEQESFITHTLSLWTRNSERKQAPLPWKGEGRGWGAGFDTLDKALVVWQDARQADAPHRRVDIIVSPWKTVGCAVLGWSGETTFQRDLRRYCKNEKSLKFDSSGIRSRVDGSWVDLESDGGLAADMEEAEKRVFAGLGLTWRPPHERCTG